MENKKFSKKIVVTLIAIVVVIGAIIGVRYCATPKADGTIDVEVIDIDGKTVKEKEIDFYSGDKLTDLVSENFDNVDIHDGMIYSIETLTTPDDWSTYICILKDDKMSEVGIEEIQYQDGTKITFEDTKNEYAQ